MPYFPEYHEKPIIETSVRTEAFRFRRRKREPTTTKQEPPNTNMSFPPTTYHQPLRLQRRIHLTPPRTSPHKRNARPALTPLIRDRVQQPQINCDTILHIVRRI